MSPEAGTQPYEGFIDLGMDTTEVHEPQPVPTGAYDLTITAAKGIFAEKEDGSGQYLKKIQCQIEINGHQNAATVFHNITLPTAEMDLKKKNFLVVLMKKFYKLFNVPMGAKGINTTDLVGATAKGAQLNLVTYDKGDGSTPRESNQIDLNGIKV